MTASIFNQLSFSAGLPAPIISALEAMALPLAYPAGTLIQLEGDPAEAMYIVVVGRVKIYRTSLTGREQILHIAGPCSHFNLGAIFDGAACPANAETITATRLLMIYGEALLDALDRYPALARSLLRELSQRLRSLIELIDDLSLHSVQGRLARLLLQIAEADERGERPDAITQATMAAQLGTVREMVARTLKSFETQGLITVDRGAITIVDRAGLERQREL